MYRTPNELYTTLAEVFSERITSDNLYSGVIELSYNEVDIRFIVTVIPFFRQDCQNGVNIYYLHNLIPVWWELHTTLPEGEVINDFDFSILKDLICR